jgi:acyl-CoA thioester hydrolase
MTSKAGWRDEWYVVPHEVTWRDLDGLGHVNNAVYFTYFEWGRTKYWFDLHRGGRTAADLGFIVARGECDFRQQLGLTELIDICVRIGEMRNSSLDFLYEIRRAATSEVAAAGKVVVVLYDWEQDSKLRISEEFRSRVEAFQRGEGS